MTFRRFEEIFKTRYPDGWVLPHGKLGGTEKSMKTTVCFSPNGKSFLYCGAYEDILCKMGIKTISKARLAETKIRLSDLRERNGKENLFGMIIDNSREIDRVEEFLSEIEREYIIE